MKPNKKYTTIIVDDPHQPDKPLTEAERKEVVAWWKRINSRKGNTVFTIRGRFNWPVSK